MSWRFKPLASASPFVMITSPAAHRLVTDADDREQTVTGPLFITACAWGASMITTCGCRVNEEAWMQMHQKGGLREWERHGQVATERFTLTVEATDATGRVGMDVIAVATPGYVSPARIADGSDADALDAWPERHLLGTRLGPNRNCRQW